jgi:hypothetical protein
MRDVLGPTTSDALLHAAYTTQLANTTTEEGGEHWLPVAAVLRDSATTEMEKK